MLIARCKKGIGKYAISKTNNELYGVGRPDLLSAKELLLFNYALSHSVYITEQDVKNIDKLITDIAL